MRSCCSPSSLCRISRAAWRHAVAGTLSPSGAGGSHKQQHNLPYRPLRPTPPPISLGLAERFSSSKRSTKKSSPAKKGTPTKYASGGEPFYVVRKGDVIGVYKNLADCQAQVSNSIVRGATFEDDTSALKNPQKMETGPSKKHRKVAEQKPLPDSPLSCILEFDGSSHGNPGKSGAGVIVRRPDGSVIAQLREGLGIATYNVASYRALLLGLRYAAENGFKYIHAQGDCELVCHQAQGLWSVKRANVADLCKKVEELKGRFIWFQANPVLKLAKFESSHASGGCASDLFGD